MTGRSEHCGQIHACAHVHCNVQGLYHTDVIDLDSLLHCSAPLPCCAALPCVTHIEHRLPAARSAGECNIEQYMQEKAEEAGNRARKGVRSGDVLGYLLSKLTSAADDQSRLPFLSCCFQHPLCLGLLPCLELKPGICTRGLQVWLRLALRRSLDQLPRALLMCVWPCDIAQAMLSISHTALVPCCNVGLAIHAKYSLLHASGSDYKPARVQALIQQHLQECRH